MAGQARSRDLAHLVPRSLPLLHDLAHSLSLHLSQGSSERHTIPPHPASVMSASCEKRWGSGQSLGPGSQSQNDTDLPTSVTDKGSKRARTESSRAAMSYPRKRAVTACRLCRARKRKCNNARPTCNLCETVGADCSYEDPLDHSA